MKSYDITDFGAKPRRDTGQASAGPHPVQTEAIQAAVDACASGGGGMVYVPPGVWTTGTLRLRSHVRFHLEAGATLEASRDAADFEPNCLFYAEDARHIALEGRGIVDGRSEYVWQTKEHPDDFIRDNMERTAALGLRLNRAFPVDGATPKMVFFLRCCDIAIRDLSFVNSPSWTMHPVGCERLVIEGVSIRTDRKSGVWADGIDPDGCRDVRIANCTIDTGDDALVFYSMDWNGPATPCENITVTNCRLSSSSSAIKFCDGNINCVRNVTISNCVITDSNRGIAFMVFDGGYVRDVVITDVTIDCRRHDWFWWGDGEPFHFNIKRRSEVHRNHLFENEPPAGRIGDIKISNVIARGEGACLIHGHPDNPLGKVEFENVSFYLDPDLEAPYTKGEEAIRFKWIDSLELRNVSVTLGAAASECWQRGVSVESVRRARLCGVDLSAARLSGGALRTVDVAALDIDDSEVGHTEPVPRLME